MTPAFRLRRIAASALLVAILGGTSAACGGQATPVEVTPIPAGLVPEKLDPDLALFEFESARKNFEEVGGASLVNTGRLYEVRRGERLVGTLQVSTVIPSVKTMDHADRKDVLDRLLSGTLFESVEVDGVQVASARNGERATYVWFGEQMFEILQLKDAKLDPDATVNGLIRYQRKTGLLPAEPEGPLKDTDIFPE